MNYTLHPGAEHDIADALDFYREQAGPVVAERFLLLLHETVELLFSAIAAPFNTAFERDAAKAGKPLNFTLGVPHRLLCG